MSNDSKNQVIARFEESGLDRRQYLALVGALATPAVAGCTGGDEETTQTTTAETTDTETGDGGGGETETTTTEEQSTSGGTLRVTMSSAINNLDPAYTNLLTAITVQRRVVEPLFKINPDLSIVESLATGVEFSDDGTTWTVSLREGVQFHEPYQREMVAEDVVYNFDRIADPDTGSSVASSLSALSDWSAIDDHTLELNLSAPDQSLQASLTNGGLSVLSPEAIEEHGDMRNQVVGTGPFVFDEWVTRDHITLVRNENYWRDGIPGVDEVVFRPISEPAVKITELQDGSIDLIQQTPTDYVSSLQDDDSITVGIKASGRYSNVHINSTTADESTTTTRNPNTPTADRQIRQAINEALNRNAFIEVIGGGYGTVTQEFYPEGNPWHIGYAPYSMGANPDAATSLIEEAGWDTPVEVHIISASDDSQLRQMGLITQENLNSAGFDAQLHEYEIGTWTDKFFAHEYDLCVNFFPYYADPAQIQRFYKTDELTTQPYESGSNNYHEEVHSLWDELTTESDEARRQELWSECQTLFIDDSVNAILFHSNIINSWRNAVQDFQVHSMSTELLVEEVTLDR